MKLTAGELLEFGLIDGIIPEGKRCLSAVNKMLVSELDRLGKYKSATLLSNRYKKYRNIDGTYKPVNSSQDGMRI